MSERAQPYQAFRETGSHSCAVTLGRVVSVHVRYVHRIGLDRMTPFCLLRWRGGLPRPKSTIPILPQRHDDPAPEVVTDPHTKTEPGTQAVQRHTVSARMLEAHTQKAPENQRRKAAYTAVFPAFHPQKSDMVKLAKILHFMVACHFSIYY